MKTPHAPLSRRSQPAQATRRDGRRRQALGATLKAVPLAVALLLGSQAAWAQTYYRAQILPDLPNANATVGRSLNDSGVIVGFNGEQNINTTAFRWSFAEGLQILGKPAQAIDITNNGTAVGFLPSPDTPGVTIPIRWSATTSYDRLSSVYAGAPADGIPWAVNDQAWVLVTDASSRDLLLLRPGQPALQVRQEVLAGLATFSFPPKINAGGMVAGAVAIPGSSSSECFIWTQTGGARTFSVVNGGLNLLGGLNDNGLVVGQASVIGEWPPTGFLYDANTGAVLRTQPGFSPRGINNSGAIVGLLLHEAAVPGGISAAEWRDGAIFNLNDVTADLGFYHLTQALDINASGQILALAVPNYNLTPPNWIGNPVTVLLSECARCGQIKPNPNPASTLLNVGPDWFDAFNAEDYRNEGTLQIRTYMANVQGAFLRNGGEIDVLTSAGRLYNTGSLENGPGGLITVAGALDTGGSGGVVNRAAVRVLEGGSMDLEGSMGFVSRSLSRFTQVGGLVRNDALFGVDEGLFDQQGGNFENRPAGTFRLWGGDAVVGGSFANAGTVLMAVDPLAPIGGPSRQSQMRISGTLQNQAGAFFTLEDASLINIDGGGLWNRGNLTLESGTSRLTLLSDGSLGNEGGTVRLGSGSRLVIAPDAGSLQQSSGSLFVEHGGRLEIGQTREFDVVGGRVNNSGVIVARSAARIANSGNFQLQTGSRLELDGGASFEQGAGELLVAAGASIIGSGLLNHFGGTTTVNGSVSLPMSVFNGGVLAGSGFISGAVVRGNTIDVRGGSSPGTLTFLGDVDMADARIELEIESHRIFDRIVVAGNLNIGQASVKLTPSAGYVPDLNDTFSWLSAGSISGNALQLDTRLLPSGWRPVAGTAAGTLELWNDAAVALAPSPNPAGTLLSVAADTLVYNDLSVEVGGTNFDNQGTVEVAGALANRPGASFVQRDGARLNVLAGGRLSNRGNITEFSGGSTIDNAGLLINHKDGAIDARTLANHGRIENDGNLEVRETLENKAAGVVVNRGRLGQLNPLSIINRGRFENHGHLAFSSITSTPDAEFVVGEGGTVEASAFSLGEFRASTGTTQVDGRLQANLIQLQGTLLKGRGTLAGPVELAGADVAPDVGTGLTVEGSVSGSATFYVGWTGPGVYSRLHVTGDLDLQPSTVVFVLSPGGYVPQAGDVLQWLDVDGVAQGLDSPNWRIVTPFTEEECAGCGFYDWTPPEHLRVSFSGGVLSVQAQAVPEPELQISALRLPDGTSLQVTLTFPVLPGDTYTVESNDTPGATGWEPLPRSPHQTGTVIDITTQPRRFYHLVRTAP